MVSSTGTVGFAWAQPGRPIPPGPDRGRRARSAAATRTSCRWPALSPDGREVWFEDGANPRSGRLLRVPLGGGDPGELARLDPEGLGAFACSRRPDLRHRAERRLARPPPHRRPHERAARAAVDRGWCPAPGRHPVRGPLSRLGRVVRIDLTGGAAGVVLAADDTYFRDQDIWLLDL
jgi:hypothetical protein